MVAHSVSLIGVLCMVQRCDDLGEVTEDAKVNWPLTAVVLSMAHGASLQEAFYEVDVASSCRLV